MRFDILEQCFATTTTVETGNASLRSREGEDKYDDQTSAHKNCTSSSYTTFRVQGGLVDGEDGQNIADALQSPSCSIRQLLITKATVSLVALERIATSLAKHNRKVWHIDFSGCTFVSSTSSPQKRGGAEGARPQGGLIPTSSPPLKQGVQQDKCGKDDDYIGESAATETVSMTTTAMRHLANLLSSGNETLTSLSLCHVPLLSMDDVQILVTTLVQDNFTLTHLDLRDNVRLLLLDDVHDVLVQLALALSRNQEAQRGKRGEIAQDESDKSCGDRPELTSQSLSSRSVASASTSSTTTTLSSQQQNQQRRRQSGSSRGLRRQECSKRWSDALKRSARGGSCGDSSQSSGSSCCSSSSKRGDADSVVSEPSSAASSFGGLGTSSTCHSLADNLPSLQGSLQDISAAPHTSFTDKEATRLCSEQKSVEHNRRRRSHNDLMALQSPQRSSTGHASIKRKNASRSEMRPAKDDARSHCSQQEEKTTKFPSQAKGGNDVCKKGGESRHAGLAKKKSSSSSSLSIQDILPSPSLSPPPASSPLRPTLLASKNFASSCSSLPPTPLRRNMTGPSEKKEDETKAFQSDKRDGQLQERETPDHNNSNNSHRDDDDDDLSQSSRLRSNSITDSSLFSESEYTTSSLQDSMTTASFDAFLDGAERIEDMWSNENDINGCVTSRPPLIVFDCSELKRAVNGESSSASTLWGMGDHMTSPLPPPLPPLVPSSSHQHTSSHVIHGESSSSGLDLCPLTPPPLHPVLTSIYSHSNQRAISDDTLQDVGLPLMPSMTSPSTSTMTTCSSSTLTTAGPVSPTRILPPPPIVRKLSSTGTALGSIAEGQQEDDDESESESSDPSTLTPVLFNDQFFAEQKQKDSFRRRPGRSCTNKKKKQQQQEELSGVVCKPSAPQPPSEMVQCTGSSSEDVTISASSSQLFHVTPPPPPLTRGSSSNAIEAGVPTSHTVSKGAMLSPGTTSVPTAASLSLSSKLSPKGTMGALATTGSSSKRLARRCGRRKAPK